MFGRYSGRLFLCAVDQLMGVRFGILPVPFAHLKKDNALDAIS
jgi:hypothetical protein